MNTHTIRLCTLTPPMLPEAKLQTHDIESPVIDDVAREVNTVVNALQRIKKSHVPIIETIVVRGSPGSKTIGFAQSLQMELSKQKAQVVRLKMDRLTVSSPYSVLADAFDQLSVLVNKSNFARNVRQKLQDSVQEGGQNVLFDFASSLRVIFDVDDDHTTDEIKRSRKLSPKASSIHRMQLLFRQVIRIVTTELHPIVFVIEDLQWANPSFLEFLKFLLLNESDSRYLLVGTYHEGSQTSDLSHWIMNLSESRLRFNRVSLEDDGPVSRARFVQTLNRKIVNLEDSAKLVLKVASLLGSHFSPDVMGTILSGLDYTRDMDLLAPLEYDVIFSTGRKELDGPCIQNGLLEKFQARYQFVNDSIYAAALRLLEDDPDKSSLIFMVGKILYLQSAEDASLLLPAVNSLNTVIEMLPRSNHYQLAQINLEASRRAASMAAFSTAADYIQQGLDLLGDNKWSNDYALSLHMTTSLADMTLAARSYVGCKIAIDEVVLHAQSFADKISVYYTLINSLGAQDRCEEAIEVGIQLLQMLGEKIRPGAFRTGTAPTKLRSQFNKNAIGFSSRPPMHDPEKLQICKLLHHLGSIALASGNDAIGFHLQCRIAQISLKDGPCEYSAQGFAALAVGLRSNDQVEEAYRSGRLALELSKRFPDAISDSLVYYQIQHWVDRFTTGLSELEATHIGALDRGCVQGAMLAAATHASLCLLSGKSLKKLGEQYRDLVDKMEGFGTTYPLMLLLPQYQFQLNMTGSSRDIIMLTGDAMSEDNFLADCAEMKCEFAQVLMYSQKMKLACYFGNFTKGYEFRQIVYQYDAKRNCSRAELTSSTFYGGLISLEMFKATSRKRHLQEAKKDLVKLQKWTKAGCVNAGHLALLLEAEHAVVNRSGSTIELYKQAIDAAAAVGYPHDRAFANERAGVFSISDNDTAAACEFMVEATRMYNRWDASAKVAQIKSKYPYLFYDHNSAVSSKHTTAKSKVSGLNLPFSSSDGMSRLASRGHGNDNAYSRRIGTRAGGPALGAGNANAFFGRRRFPTATEEKTSSGSL